MYENRKPIPLSVREDGERRPRPTSPELPSTQRTSERAAPKIPGDELLREMGIKPFSEEYRRLVRMTGENDFSSTKTAYALLRAQLAMVIGALPQAELNSARYGNERATYALIGLSSHLRELQHDLRAFGDQTELVDKVRKDVVQGVLQGLATDVVSGLIKTRHALHAKLPPKLAKEVDALLRSYQEQLTVTFTEADSRAAELLQRALTTR